MGEDFKVKITNPERAKALRDTVGDDEVFVISLVGEVANLPGLEKRMVFKLDLDMYTQKAKEKLAEHIAAKFHLDIEFVKTNLTSSGVPILDEDCTVILKNPQRWI